MEIFHRRHRTKTNKTKYCDKYGPDKERKTKQRNKQKERKKAEINK